ncbi:MAG: prephenate dehydratase domain-containing protein [Gammaproteobacteria bacterium]|nr:prephenate dehydratase domain-containing protein [Gammaproteobacteria bacterium]
MRIGVQGAIGSFSEAAGKKWLSSQNHTADIDYLISAHNVLSALDNGSIDYGVIAISNNRGGIVLESIEALAQYQCKIIDRLSLLVQQNLLVLPGTKLDDIREIHSHHQALRQCRDYIYEYLSGAKLIEAEDTALSAERLQTGLLPKTAAVIASRQCAELYGLSILQENVHDITRNETLFLVLQRP